MIERDAIYIDGAWVPSGGTGTIDVYGAATEVRDRTGMKVGPLIVTPQELRSRGQLGDALRAGQVLYERP